MLGSAAAVCAPRQVTCAKQDMQRRQGAALKRLARAKLQRMTRTSEALNKFAKDEIASWKKRRADLQRDISEALQVLDTVARQDIEDIKNLHALVDDDDTDGDTPTEPVVFKPE